MVIFLGAREGIAAIGTEFRAGEAVEVIEEHIIALVGIGLGVAVDELAAAVAGAGVVGLAVAPVKDGAVVIGHHAFVGLADKGLGALGGKQAAGFLRVGRIGEDAADQGQRVVELALGLVEPAETERRGGEAVVP
jgi:hypothetical protein